MIQIIYLIDCLERTPIILNNLLKYIPQKHIKERRIEKKWSIHEQVCHLCDAQHILIDRFKRFEKEDNPLIEGYEPPFDLSNSLYLNMELKTILSNFSQIRTNMVLMLKAYDENYWSLKGRHEAFEPYNTQILLTHCLNVDYAHIFNIEQRGFTKSKFINQL